MMKIRYIMLAILVTLVVSGCSSEKQLKCTSEEDGVQYEMLYTYDKDIKTIKTTFTFTADDKDTYEITKAQFNTVDFSKDNTAGVINEVKMDDAKMSISMIVNVILNKLTDEEKKEMEFDDLDKYYKDGKINIQSVKKDLEKDGFTCK